MSDLTFSIPTEQDIPRLRDFFTDDRVRRFLGGPVSEQVADQRIREEISSWKTEGFGSWIARSGERPVAHGGLSVYDGGPRIEVSYEVLPEEWGKGYGLEIVSHSVDFAFGELGIDELWAETQSANKPSRRILEQAGFQFDSELERHGAQQSVYMLRKD